MAQKVFFNRCIKAILVILIASSLLFSPVHAGFTSNLVKQGITKHIKGQQATEKKEKDKKNNKYLRIRGKVYRDEKLTKAEQEFWDECIERLKDKQVVKHKKEYQKQLVKNAPTWKKVGSDLFGQWIFKLEQQPEWQPQFYTDAPMIEEQIFEVPEELKELPGVNGGIIINAPSPLPLPVMP